jgi:hypothetical protein
VCYRYVAPDIISKEGVVTHLQQTWGGGFSILAYYYYSKREKQMMHPIWVFFQKIQSHQVMAIFVWGRRERERERERNLSIIIIKGSE